MEMLFTALKYLFFGFFGLVVAIFVLAAVFGKRRITKWEYEAEFRDERGREFGEFDIEMSRIEKDEPNFSLKAEFKMRHPSLRLHQTIQVVLEDTLVLEGMVREEGRIRLTAEEHLQNEVADAQVGQLCRIVSGGTTLFEQPLELD